jgi:hypothetical protein
MHHRVRKIRNGRRWRRFNLLHRFRSDERGVQLVEVAIVIPITLMLFAAVGEFGRYFYEYTTLAKAERAGARQIGCWQQRSWWSTEIRPAVERRYCLV